MPRLGPFVVRNDTGHAVDDVHVVFAGTGGVLAGATLVSTPVPGEIAAGGNSVDIKWSQLVQQMQEASFTVDSDFPNIEMVQVTWSRGGEPIPSAGGSRTRMAVINTDRQVSDFSVEILRRSLRAGGLGPSLADSRAIEIGRALAASGVNPVPTDAIRFSVGEFNTTDEPDLLRLGNVIRSGRFSPGIVSVFPGPVTTGGFPADPSLSGMLFNIVDSLTDMSALQEEADVTPLRQLLLSAAEVGRGSIGDLADIGDFEQTQLLGQLVATLSAGGRVSDDPERFLLWRDQLVNVLQAFIDLTNQRLWDPFAPAALQSFAGGLANLALAPLLRQGDFAWQAGVLNGLCRLRRDFGITILDTAVFAAWLDGLRHDCPPCTDDCPYEAATLYKTGTLSNPHNCVIKDQRIIKVPFLHIWIRTCDWDAKVLYRRVFQCRKVGGSPLSICCWSIYEWERNETWKYRQQIVNLSSTVPNNWEDEVTDYRFGDKSIAPPPDAKKVY